MGDRHDKCLLSWVFEYQVQYTLWVQDWLVFAQSSPPPAPPQTSGNTAWNTSESRLTGLGTSLVAQWLRIRLPVQGTRVWSLVQEDPTCRRATNPASHNYWSPGDLEPACCNYWTHALQLLKPVHLEPMLRNKRSPRTTMKSSPCSPQLEKACAQQQRPNTTKNLKKKKD